MLPIIEFQLDENLKQHGISRIAKEGTTIIVQYNDKPLRFDIDRKKWAKTVDNFQRASIGLINEQETKQAIIFWLSVQWRNLHDDGNGRTNNIIDTINSNDTYRDNSSEDNEEQKSSTLTVAQAMRQHSGRMTVVGMIVTMSELYQLITKAVWKCYSCGAQVNKRIAKITEPPSKPRQCPSCGSFNVDFEEMHDYVNAVTLNIQDDIPDTTLEPLSVIVFEKDTEEIHVGENVKIIGRMEKVQDRRSKKYHSIILAELVKYEHRKKLSLFHNDLTGIKRFAGKLPIQSNAAYLCNFKHRILGMLAPNIIGHEYEKLALLLSVIGAPEANNRRGRIHVLLIGPAGLAKTKLSREILRIRPNSRYVSAKNTTGKSLTAMVLKEDDNYVLNLGPVPLAKNAVCVVNEFDKMNPEEQDSLLDVMEEGEITVNKFAKLRTIKSPTTIIATANPRNNKWKDSAKISRDEIPFETTILSRFDMVLVFRDSIDEKANREFAYKKTEQDEKHLEHNYNFLQNYVEYARSINPFFTEEARSILNEYWVRLKKREELAFTNRALESLHRISKSFARLYLTDTVDVKIAYETIDFMDKMVGEYNTCVYHILDPKSAAYEETIKVIQKHGLPIDLVEAVRIVCQSNEQIRHYIGNTFKRSRNKKLRLLCNKILDNNNIQIVQSSPVAVHWVTTGKEENSGNNNSGDNDTGRDLNDLNDLPSVVAIDATKRKSCGHVTCN